MSRKYIALHIAIGLFLLSELYILAFNREPELQTPNGNLRVTASFYTLEFFAKKIGGEFINVYPLTPNGVEPHEYEPTPNDMTKILQSDILFLNGGGLETWQDKIRKNLGKKTLVVIVGDELFEKSATDEFNPHIWLSPRLAKIMTRRISAALQQADSVHKNYFEKRADFLEKELTELDGEFKASLNNCSKHTFITTHSAFGYLAKDYNLTEVAIAGLSPDSEPSPKQLARIASLAQNNDIKYIFSESLGSPKFSKTIANEIGAQTLTLDPLEGLSDKDIKNGENYFTVMKRNLNNLKIGLECKT